MEVPKTGDKKVCCFGIFNDKYSQIYKKNTHKVNIPDLSLNTSSPQPTKERKKNLKTKDEDIGLW